MRVIYAVINLLILGGALFLFARKPVLRMFRDRREEIARQLRRSEEGLAAAQEEESAIARLREENPKGG